MNLIVELEQLDQRGAELLGGQRAPLLALSLTASLALAPLPEELRVDIRSVARPGGRLHGEVYLLYAVFAYVPAFFSQLQADRDRLGAELVARWRELLGDRIRWVEPLTADEMIELFGRLARLHGVARGWAAWDRVEADGQRLVALCQRRRSSTRDLVRNSVALLEQRYAEQEAARNPRDRT